MVDAKEVIANYRIGPQIPLGERDAEKIIAALAAAGLKVVAREPTMAQGGEHPGVADLWRAMWDAAPPVKGLDDL